MWAFLEERPPVVKAVQVQAGQTEQLWTLVSADTAAFLLLCLETSQSALETCGCIVLWGSAWYESMIRKENYVHFPF